MNRNPQSIGGGLKEVVSRSYVKVVAELESDESVDSIESADGSEDLTVARV